jgi:hypothetical protein
VCLASIIRAISFVLFRIYSVGPIGINSLFLINSLPMIGFVSLGSPSPSVKSIVAFINKKAAMGFYSPHRVLWFRLLRGWCLTKLQECKVWRNAAVNGGADPGGCDYLGELGHWDPAVWVRLEVISKLFVLGVPALVGAKV